MKIFLTTLGFLICHLATGEAKTLLAENGKAAMSIVISPEASETTRKNAKTLSEYLKKVTGADFAVETGDGSSGIVFGPASDFPHLAKSPEFDPTDPLRTEEYLLFSHPEGLQLVGATDLGAQNAMWDFLHRQGYRNYFPGEVWEVIPSVSRLEVEYDEIQKPDYHMRSVWNSSGGLYPERAELIQDWRKKNRMQSGAHIHAGHSYHTIQSRNAEFFQSHPEYLNDGKKPRLWRPEVREFFVEQYLNGLRARPDSTSISVDPSDGSGWDLGPESRAFGSISDQVITLANEVAEAALKEFPQILVGLYAYNDYAEPPTIRVHPRVAVLVATWFRKTDLSLPDQVGGWAKQGAKIGIRDYLSFPAMDYDVPSRAQGARAIDPFVKKWRDYHAWGARYYSGEAQDNWAINGLLYYASSRSLWDLDEPVTKESIFEEFLEKCFGPAKEAIRPYYEELDLRPTVDEDIVNRLFTAIAEARTKTDDPAILKRLNDLTLYARYLELNSRYTLAGEGSEKRAAVESMFTHLYRARLHSVNHARGIMRDMNKRASVSETPEESSSLRRGVPPWTPDVLPYTDEEIVQMVGDGLKNNARLDFPIPSYSADLVPAQSLFPDAVGPESARMGIGGKSGRSLFYTWANEPGTTWKLQISHLNKEPISVEAQFWAKDEAEEAPVSIQKIEIGPEGTAELTLTSPHQGLHWVFLSGPRSGYQIEPDPDRPLTISAAREAPLQTLAAMSGANQYFYVPKGTRLIAARLSRSGRGAIVNPDGQIALTIDRTGLIRVEVPDGMDGKLWSISKWRGGFINLLTVPSYFAPSPKDLLLPREVVEADPPLAKSE